MKILNVILCNLLLFVGVSSYAMDMGYMPTDFGDDAYVNLDEGLKVNLRRGLESDIEHALYEKKAYYLKDLTALNYRLDEKKSSWESKKENRKKLVNNVIVDSKFKVPFNQSDKYQSQVSALYYAYKRCLADKDIDSQLRYDLLEALVNKLFEGESKKRVLSEKFEHQMGRNKYEDSLLSLALYSRDFDVAKLLIQNGASMKNCDQNKRGVLHWIGINSAYLDSEALVVGQARKKDGQQVSQNTFNLQKNYKDFADNCNGFKSWVFDSISKEVQGTTQVAKTAVNYLNATAATGHKQNATPKTALIDAIDKRLYGLAGEIIGLYGDISNIREIDRKNLISRTVSSIGWTGKEKNKFDIAYCQRKSKEGITFLNFLIKKGFDKYINSPDTVDKNRTALLKLCRMIEGTVVHAGENPDPRRIGKVNAEALFRILLENGADTRVKDEAFVAGRGGKSCFYYLCMYRGEPYAQSIVKNFFRYAQDKRNHFLQALLNSKIPVVVASPVAPLYDPLTPASEAFRRIMFSESKTENGGLDLIEKIKQNGKQRIIKGEVKPGKRKRFNSNYSSNINQKRQDTKKRKLGSCCSECKGFGNVFVKCRNCRDGYLQCSNYNYNCSGCRNCNKGDLLCSNYNCRGCRNCDRGYLMCRDCDGSGNRSVSCNKCSSSGNNRPHNHNNHNRGGGSGRSYQQRDYNRGGNDGQRRYKKQRRGY